MAVLQDQGRIELAELIKKPSHPSGLGPWPARMGCRANF